MSRQLGGRVDADRPLAVRLVHRRLGEPGEQPGAAVGGRASGQQPGVVVDEAGVQPPRDEVLLVEEGAQERDVGGHAADPELVDRAAGLLHGELEGAPAAGELGEHRVEVGGDLGAGVRRTAVEADAATAGGAVRRDPAGVGPEAVRRVLGGDPALQRGAAQPDRVLVEAEVGQGLAGCDPQLGLHEVDVGDLLGHGVLDLDPRVHLDEVVVAVGAEQELHRAGVAVADLGREPYGVRTHPLAEVGVEVGRRGDLDDLLVPPLDRAVALEEVDHVALGVGEDLHLDVPRVDHGLLDEHGRVAERALGLAHAGVDRVLEVLLLVHLAHAAAAATGDGLDEERVVQALRRFHQLVEVVVGRDRLERRDVGVLRGLDRAGLVAGEREHVGRRADEGDAGVGACLCEVGVLGQEAVARVDRVGARLHRDLDDRLRVQVGAHGVAALADLVGLVGLHPVLGPAVLVGKDGHRAGAGLGRGPVGTDRDLATVGDQDLVEHGSRLVVRDHGRVSSYDAGRRASRRVLADPTVDGLADEVGVARVPAVLLDQVAEQPTQAGMGAVGQGDVDRLVGSAVGQRLVEPRAGPLDGAVPELVELFRGVVAAELKSQSGSVSQSPLSHGAPSGVPLSFGPNVWSSTSARCLRSPPSVSEETPIWVPRPVASRSSAFQRKVARRRSSAPTRCSASVPANGGSHQVSSLVMRPPYW